MKKIKNILIILLLIIILILVYYIRILVTTNNTNINNNSNNNFWVNNVIYSNFNRNIKYIIDKNIWNKLKINDRDILSNILEYNWLMEDIFIECNKDISIIRWKDFWNSQLNSHENLYNFNFWNKLNCKNDKNNKLCLDIKKIELIKRKKNLDDISLLIYWLYTWNISFDNYEKILANKSSLNFNNMLPDLTYSEYYWYLITNRLKTQWDCINFILKEYKKRKWNTQ